MRRKRRGRAGRRLAPVEEGADVVERPNPFGAECHDHAPMICSHSGSCSLPVGNRLPAHAHFSLDNANPPLAALRLVPHHGVRRSGPSSGSAGSPKESNNSGSLQGQGRHIMRRSLLFTPIRRCLAALNATASRLPAAAGMFAVAAVIAIGLSAASPVLGNNTSSLSAQCFVCDVAECKDGGGGSACNTHHEGESVICTTTGGCTCIKIERWWWFDTQVCTPILAGAVEEMPGTKSSNDIRYVTLDGTDVALHRVGWHHFAAQSCQGGSNWVILGRQLATGRINVTTNPLMIELNRRLFRLSDDSTTATILE